LAIIGIAAVFIFGPNQRPKIDTAKVEAHLIGAPEPVLPQAKDVSNGAAFRRESP
jgi:hypothetical protein